MKSKITVISMHLVRLFYHELRYITLLLIKEHILVGDHIGHPGSTEGTNKFLLITRD